MVVKRALKRRMETKILGADIIADDLLGIIHSEQRVAEWQER